MTTEGSRGRVAVEQPRCPYCHEAIRPGHAQLACNACRAWHHEACWGEGGDRCAACGSSATGRTAAAAPPSLVVFPCPACAARLTARSDAAEPVDCPSCGARAAVPGAAAAAAVDDGPAAGPPVEIALAPVTAAVFAAMFGLVGLLAGALLGLGFAAPGHIGAWAARGYGVTFVLGAALFLRHEVADAPPRLRRGLRAGATLSLLAPALHLSGVLDLHLAWLLPYPWYVGWWWSARRRRRSASAPTAAK